MFIWKMTVTVLYITLLESLVGFLIPFTAPAITHYLLVCFLRDVFLLASVLILYLY